MTKRIYPLLLCLLLTTMTGVAGTIRGRVVDAQTGEAVIGAALLLGTTNQNDVTKLNGSYVIKNVAPGTYQLRISYITYKIITKELMLRKPVSNVQLTD